MLDLARLGNSSDLGKIRDSSSVLSVKGSKQANTKVKCCDYVTHNDKQLQKTTEKEIYECDVANSVCDSQGFVTQKHLRHNLNSQISAVKAFSTIQ